MKKLACLGHPVILYDQVTFNVTINNDSFNLFMEVGCGESTFVADPTKDASWLLTIDYYTFELYTLIQHLNLTEYYINGHSWGIQLVILLFKSTK